MINSISLLSACDKFNWYGFLIGMAMVIAIIAAYFMSVKRGYYKDVIFDVAIICIPLAIIGARLYYVIFDIIGTGSSWTFTQILGIDSGGLSGLSIFGGLIGALIGAGIIHFWKRKKPEKNKITFMQMADLCFGMVLLAQAIGRWGNFANQEAFGPKVNWNFFPFTVEIDAAHATNGAGYYLATFFYESMWNLVGAAILLWLYNGRRKSFDGFVFSIYCIFYGVGRAVIETLRQDPLMAGNVRVSQLTAILFALFGIFYIGWYIYTAKKKDMKLFIFVDSALLDESYYGYRQSILHHPNIFPKKGEVIQDLETDSIDDFYDSPSDDFYNTDTTSDDFYSDNSISENSVTSEEILNSVNAAVSETAAKNANSQTIEEVEYNKEVPKVVEIDKATTTTTTKPKATTATTTKPKISTNTKPKATTSTTTKPKPKSSTNTKPKLSATKEDKE